MLFHAVLTTVLSSSAGSQCGRMRHKENARALSFPHGAIGFVVSLHHRFSHDLPSLCLYGLTKCNTNPNLLSKSQNDLLPNLLFALICSFFPSKTATTWSMTHQRRRTPVSCSTMRRTRLLRWDVRRDGKYLGKPHNVKVRWEVLGLLQLISDPVSDSQILSVFERAAVLYIN